jgi:hypothetical protein
MQCKQTKFMDRGPERQVARNAWAFWIAAPCCEHDGGDDVDDDVHDGSGDNDDDDDGDGDGGDRDDGDTDADANTPSKFDDYVMMPVCRPLLSISFFHVLNGTPTAAAFCRDRKIGREAIKASNQQDRQGLRGRKKHASPRLGRTLGNRVENCLKVASNSVPIRRKVA